MLAPLDTGSTKDPASKKSFCQPTFAQIAMAADGTPQ